MYLIKQISNLSSLIKANVTKLTNLQGLLVILLPNTLMLAFMLLLGNSSRNMGWKGMVLSYVLSIVAMSIWKLVQPKTKTTQLTFFVILLVNLVFMILGTHLGVLFLLRLPFLYLLGAFLSLLLYEQQQKLGTPKQKFRHPPKTIPLLDLLNKKLATLPLFKRVEAEERLYVFVVALLGLVGLILRFINLTLLDTYVDEDHHLEAAYQLLNDGNFTYPRAKIVTFMVAAFCGITGADTYEAYLFWGRVPSVLMGVITIIPLYILAKKISKPVALITVALWVFSPWAIGISKYAREHIYYVPIILTFVLVVLRFAALLKNYTPDKQKQLLQYGLGLVAVMLFSLLFDYFSTLKLSIVFFALFFVAYFASDISFFIEKGKTIFQSVADDKTWYYMVLFGIIGINVVLITLSFFDVPFIALLKQKYQMGWIDIYLNPNLTYPLNLWSSSTTDSYLIYCLLLFSLCFLTYRKHKIASTYFIAFVLLMVLYFYFFDRYYKPRYIFYVYPLFLVLMAYSFWNVFQTIQLFDNATYRQIASIFVGFALIIGSQVSHIYEAIAAPTYSLDGSKPTTWENLSTDYSTGAFVQTTGEIHLEKRTMLNFFKRFPIDSLRKMPLIISKYDAAFAIEFGMQDIYEFNVSNPEKFNNAYDYMWENQEGWMVLDAYRNGKGGNKNYPHGGTFRLRDLLVEVEKTGQHYQIYHWRPIVAGEELVYANYIPENVLHSRLVPNIMFNDTKVNLSKPFSVSFWIKSEVANPGKPISFGKSYSDGIGIEELPRRGSVGGYRVRINDPSEDDGMNIGYVNNGKWNHVVYFQTGGAQGDQCGIYLNGILKDRAFYAADKTGKVPFKINRINGYLQDVRFYNRDLTRFEIKTLYNEGEVMDDQSILPESLTPLKHWKQPPKKTGNESESKPKSKASKKG